MVGAQEGCGGGTDLLLQPDVLLVHFPHFLLLSLLVLHLLVPLS